MLKTAIARSGKMSVREAFKNEEGAIDLASIMVGIIVIGIIGGVIAATVFAVIPWAQDNAAKGVLDSVATAESAYRGFSAEIGAEVNAFGTEGQLNADADETQGVVLESLFNDAGDDVTIVVDADGNGYKAYSVSQSGKVFSSTDGAKAVEELTLTKATVPASTVFGD